MGSLRQRLPISGHNPVPRFSLVIALPILHPSQSQHSCPPGMEVKATIRNQISEVWRTLLKYPKKLQKPVWVGLGNRVGIPE